MSNIIVTHENVDAVFKVPGGGTIEVHIPGIELEIALPFEIDEEGITNFVYDLTVEGESITDYDLAPVAGESGVMEEGEFELIGTP